jgi:protein-S-isoprenylcysteine O-methyltransferase Ste14
MPLSAYLILAAGTILWVAPFPLAMRRGGTPQRLDKRARWGVALEGVAYTLLWQGPFWRRSPAVWQLAASIVSFALACVLSWTGAAALGKHLRVDAVVGEDHRLVQTGPYRFVRHPIYASMLGVLLGTGVVLSPLWMLPIAVAIFLAGTEIRVRIEDGLLAARFGEEFLKYQRSVPAYLPFVR